MIRRMALAIVFLIIWFLVILPITPYLYSSIMSYVDSSNIPLEFSYTMKTPIMIRDNQTNLTKIIYNESVQKVDFKPAIGVALLIVLYLTPIYSVYKIMTGGRRRW